jgi:hypothetical protein
MSMRQRRKRSADGQSSKTASMARRSFFRRSAPHERQRIPSCNARGNFAVRRTKPLGCRPRVTRMSGSKTRASSPQFHLWAVSLSGEVFPLRHDDRWSAWPGIAPPGWRHIANAVARGSREYTTLSACALTSAFDQLPCGTAANSTSDALGTVNDSVQAVR